MIDQFLKELDNHLVGRFGLTISLRVVGGRCGVAQQEVLHKCVNDLVVEMYAFVANEMKWAAKTGEDVVVQEFGSVFGGVVSKCNCFDPFCGVIRGHQNVSVASECV